MGPASPHKDEEPVTVHESHTLFKAWISGTQFTHSLPKSEKDPWKVSYQILSRADSARCKAWNEEVQNLLIFAGLFSAVVTAFIIESYKFLEPDHSETTALLLSRISFQLQNGTQQDFKELDPFTPPASAIRINTLWFLSLVFSLATVLVGIVSLQWVREHQRTSDSQAGTRHALSMLHMQTDAFERWYVPHIFTLLPLLLQIGLVFFFAGICDFLLHLNRTVAIPVLTAIGLTLAFLLLTTILPALQDLTTYFPRIHSHPTKPRAPCPYRSPQSWAFLKLSVPLLRLLNNGIVRPLTWRRYWKSHFRDKLFWRNFMDHEDTLNSWTTHSSGWLYQRDIDCAMSGTSYSPKVIHAMTLRDVHPLYDCMVGLLSVRDRLVSTKNDGHEVAYSCFEGVLQDLEGQLYKREFNVYVHRLLSRVLSRADIPMNMVTQGELEFVKDANRLLFCHLPRENQISIREHLAELCVRLSRGMFSRRRGEFHASEGSSELWDTINELYDIPGLAPQFTSMLEHFFIQAATAHPTYTDLQITSKIPAIETNFLESAARIICSNQSTDFVRSTHETIFMTIAARLRMRPLMYTRRKNGVGRYTSMDVTTETDYLFIAISAYLYNIDSIGRLTHVSDDLILQDILYAIKQYKERWEQRSQDDPLSASVEYTRLLANHFDMDLDDSDRWWFLLLANARPRYCLVDRPSVHRTVDETAMDVDERDVGKTLRKEDPWKQAREAASGMDNARVEPYPNGDTSPIFAESSQPVLPLTEADLDSEAMGGGYGYGAWSYSNSPQLQDISSWLHERYPASSIPLHPLSQTISGTRVQDVTHGHILSMDDIFLVPPEARRESMLVRRNAWMQSKKSETAVVSVVRNDEPILEGVEIDVVNAGVAVDPEEEEEDKPDNEGGDICDLKEDSRRVECMT